MFRLLLIATAVVSGVVAAVPTTASAEVADYAQDSWGVYNSVTSGTLTDVIDNEVFAIEQIGDTIYVGGKFTEVRATNGSTPVAQPYLAAFEASTGDWIPDFDPALNRPVYALQASPDGSRLFVGGEFGDVAGVANTQALVALDPATGDVDTSWKSQLKRDGRAVVFTLDLDETWLYVGGSFSAVGGAQGVPLTSVSRAVKLDLDTAAPDTSWSPTVSGGGVWGIAVSPDRSTVYLAGFFSSVNLASGTQGFVGVDNSTGSSIEPGRIDHNNTRRPYYQDVLAVNGLVFVAGMEHITWVLNEGNLDSVQTKHSTGGTTGSGFQMGGDYQDLELVGDRVYAACHCRNEHFADGDIFTILSDGVGSYSRRDPIKFVAAYSAIDGSYDPAFQLDVSGSSGVWAIHGATDGCLWVGGDLTRATRANGTNQARGGFSRHCDESYVVDTERPSVPQGVTLTPNGSQVDMTWSASTDNVGVAGYEIYRATENGGLAELVATTDTTTYSDQGLADGTYWYYLRAVDAAGNTSWRTGYKSATVGQTIDTQRPTVPNGVAVVVGGDGNDVDLTWNASTDDVGVVGYDIYRATSQGGPYTVIATEPTTAFQDADLTDGTYWYYLRAVDAAGNTSWRTGYKSVEVTGAVADTERPSPPKGLMVAAVGTDSIDLTWTASTDNIGVAGYQIFDSAGTVVGVASSTTGTVTGLASGTTYSFYVKALDDAGNTSWRSNTQSATTN